MSHADIRFLGTLISIVYGLCLIFYYWSRNTSAPRLACWLKWSAIVWALALSATTLLYAVVEATCEGNWLQGFYNCTSVSLKIANSSFTYAFIAYALAALYAILLALVGLVVESRVAASSDS